MVYLYHYTSRESAERIKEEGVLRACHPHGNRNAPKSVYLTQVEPNSSTEKILVNNYSLDIDAVFHKLARKAEFYFTFNSDDLPGVIHRKPKKEWRNEWVYPHDIDLTKVFYQGCHRDDDEYDSDESEYDSYDEDDNSSESDSSSGSVSDSRSDSDNSKSESDSDSSSSDDEAGSESNSGMIALLSCLLLDDPLSSLKFQ